MSPARRSPLMGRLSGLFRGIFARESWTLSQSYYYGSVRNNPSHRVELIDGTPIDQHHDLDAIWIGPPAGTAASSDAGDDAGGDARADAELIARIVSGAGFHTEMTALAARYVGRGMSPASIETLAGLMLSHPEAARVARWTDRFASIPAIVASAARKFTEAAEHRRAIATLAGRMIRARRCGADVRVAIQAEAEARGIELARAAKIADWVAESELARRRARHA